MEELKEYEIWMEGYAATGERGYANLIGKAKGKTFNEACNNFRYIEELKDYKGKVIIDIGDKLGLDKEYDYPSIWACKLYDNEKDARKSFG